MPDEVLQRAILSLLQVVVSAGLILVSRRWVRQESSFKRARDTLISLADELERIKQTLDTVEAQNRLLMDFIRDHTEEVKRLTNELRTHGIPVEPN